MEKEIIMKSILIIGANSYIGTSFEQYLNKYENVKKEYEKNEIYRINTIDSINLKPKKELFIGYDTVFYVAGIVHKKEKRKDKVLYYKVNRDLAVKVAIAAKKAEVKQFIILSSMSVYGKTTGYITKLTKPTPINCYGRSKLQADQIIWKLNNENFKVAILRPPMVYGRNCKGNYQSLRRIALLCPIFPELRNQRSMIYIDNLCEFIKNIVDKESAGIFFPQNDKYVCTSRMVKSIAYLHKKKIKTTKVLNQLIDFIPLNITRKVFGNLTYEMSDPVGKFDFKESIVLSEVRTANKFQKTVLILSNEHSWTYNLRKELVEELLKFNYRVVLALPYGEKVELLKKMGCEFVNVSMFERHGTNPIKEVKLFFEYKKVLAQISPDVVLTYTIKPNLYGGLAAKQEKVPFISNITGLGGAILGSTNKIKSSMILGLYKISLSHARIVFFQNIENLRFMLAHHVITAPYSLLPGSGVNLVQHCMEEYPENTGELIFTTIGRIMKDKGIDELLEAATSIKKKYSNVHFRLIGFFDDDYQKKVETAVADNIIEYLGQQDDIHFFIKESHAIIHPSYHEGMSNVLLEAASTGRPVLASKIPGCQETFDEGISGFSFAVKDSKDLEKVIDQFINMPYEDKIEMGRRGRKKMEEQFDRRIVVEEYMREIQKILEEG